MKRIILLSCFAWAWNLVHAQTNLVPNPGFETVVNCPTGIGQLYNTSNWINPNSCSPDFFHQCGTMGSGTPTNSFGNQVPKSGLGYGGFYTYNSFANNERDYLQIVLSDTLEWGRMYLVSFYVSLSDYMDYATNKVGAFFSTASISGSTCALFYLTPQIENPITNPLNDQTGWALISDTFYANGGEIYLTIGNFYPDTTCGLQYVANNGYAGSYYYIDDVSVIDIGPSGINAYGSPRFEVTTFPNPSNGIVNITFEGLGEKNTVLMAQITNTLSEILVQENLSCDKGNFSMDLSSLSKGVYFLSIGSEKTGYQFKKIIIQ